LDLSDLWQVGGEKEPREQVEELALGQRLKGGLDPLHPDVLADFLLLLVESLLSLLLNVFYAGVQALAVIFSVGLISALIELLLPQVADQAGAQKDGEPKKCQVFQNRDEKEGGCQGDQR
jgi:hypothetical protein